jgi:hypothetical protein
VLPPGGLSDCKAPKWRRARRGHGHAKRLGRGRLPRLLLDGRERGRSQLPQPRAACGRRRLWRARKEGPK